jgi:hypothetical protein
VVFIVDRYTQSTNFQNLSKSNWTLFPKENLFPITCSTSVQICKNFRGQKVFISGVQTEQINSVSDLGKIASSFCLTIILGGPNRAKLIQYLLQYWDMVCVYHPDHSKIFGDHIGAILVQRGALMDLQQGFQVAYPITIQSNQFS